MRGLASLPLALLFMGCLVTEDVEFIPEEGCPPAISSAPDAANPLNQLIEINLDGFSEEELASGALQFDVVVRDCNVSQSLVYQVWKNRDPRFGSNDGVFGDFLPPTPSNAKERELSFDIELASLALEQTGFGECHKFELFVTGAFSPNPPTPQEMGDVDNATWWVSVYDDNTSEENIARLGDCP